MHIYFSGIGGTAIGPLALIASQAGYDVSGSDKQDSNYISYLKKQGITQIHIGQSGAELKTLHEKKPIDWLVYSSALVRENPNHPEITAATKLGIRTSKRDDFINKLLEDSGQKMIAVAGTHGKTTTTSMFIWLLKQLEIPISYSVGGKLSFGEMGEFNPKAEYFIYEADEYDRNFLSFEPEVAVITGIAYDHPDIYPTEESYIDAFEDFIYSSGEVFGHNEDLAKVNLEGEGGVARDKFTLIGDVNRKNAQLVVETVSVLFKVPLDKCITIVNNFPGVSRRFEKISENIYSDYAHTVEKIQGALQIAHEVAGDNVVVVYEGLHNTRQHFIKDELKSLFKGVKKLYIVPSYLAREDESLELLTPQKLCRLMQVPNHREPAELNDLLKSAMKKHIEDADLVLCLTAGGGGSLDEWLRKTF